MIRRQRTDDGRQIRRYNKYMIKDVTDLRIYQIALGLLPELAKLLPKVPYRKIRFQTIDSAKSISAQIAEGYAKKNSVKEFKRFLEMALGSSDEVITHLRQIYLLYVNNIDRELLIKLGNEYKELSK